MTDFLCEQVGVHFELSEEEKFYRNALTRMPDGPAALEEAYDAVMENVSEVEQYVKVMHSLLFRSLFSYILLHTSQSRKMPQFIITASWFQVWLQYQCLWDMQPENIYNRLGEDLNKWQLLLVQIRKARGTFDNAETRKEFGPVIIDYGKVNPFKFILFYIFIYIHTKFS